MPESKFVLLEGAVHGWLVRHSMSFLRITMGLVFLGFGVLKFFPGASPAQDLAVTTTRLLTFGLVPDPVGLVLVAALECVIGLSLVVNRGLRVTIYLLAAELVGILSPLVLLPGRLFPGPAHLPTLEAQYVLKDIVLVAAAMVIATTFRGARIRLAAGPGGAAPADTSSPRQDLLRRRFDSGVLVPTAQRPSVGRTNFRPFWAGHGTDVWMKRPAR